MLAVERIERGLILAGSKELGIYGLETHKTESDHSDTCFIRLRPLFPTRGTQEVLQRTGMQCSSVEPCFPPCSCLD